MSDLLSGPRAAEFYTPRMLRRKAIYLNKSNTKWLEIGITPGETFSSVAYFCGKGIQVQIPCSLEVFFEKIGGLSGVSPSGTAKSILMRATNQGCNDLSVIKADYCSGIYKIFNPSDSERAAYATTATLSYLREIGKAIKGLHNSLSAADVKEEFTKIVSAATHVADHLETTDYELIEGELLQNPPDDVNVEMFYEILANFRNFFHQQLRTKLYSPK